MNRENLIKSIKEIVEGRNLLLIETVIRGDDKKRIIEVYIDGEEAVTSDICKDVSDLIKVKLEEENLIESNFRLDVSSPGVDRPLKFLKQYRKHINRNFNLAYTEGKEEKSIKTKLTGIDDDVLTFNNGKNEIRIRFEEIKSAKVIISF